MRDLTLLRGFIGLSGQANSLIASHRLDLPEPLHPNIIVTLLLRSTLRLSLNLLKFWKLLRCMKWFVIGMLVTLAVAEIVVVAVESVEGVAELGVYSSSPLIILHNVSSCASLRSEDDEDIARSQIFEKKGLFS